VGLLVRVPRAIAMRWLTAAVVLNLVDWSAEIAGLHGNWMLARLALGIALGLTAAMLVASSGEIQIAAQAKAA